MSGLTIRKSKTTTEELLEKRARFESELAIAVAESGPIEGVDRISAKMIQLLTENRATVLRIIRNTPKIFDDLLNRDLLLFGQLDASDVAEENPKAIYDKMLNTLESPESSLHQIMHIHAAFIYRIAPHLAEFKTDAKKAELAVLKAQLGPKHLFSHERRLRCDNAAGPCSTLGFARGEFELSKTSVALHRAARDIFRPNPDWHDYHRQVTTHAMPFVAGISHHTASFMLNALWLTDLKRENSVERNLLQQYAMASFSYLGAGGNHSFDEVMSAARLAGAKYVDGVYDSAISPRFADTFLRVASEHKTAVNPFFHAATSVAVDETSSPALAS